MGLFDPDRIPPELRFDIREFGTGVVPGVDCSQAIAAAIAAAVAVPDPALVYFPPGRWVVSPQMARTTSTTTITAQGHAIVVPAAGGELKRLTSHPGTDVAVAWSPDGKRVLFRSSREAYSRFEKLFTVPATMSRISMLSNAACTK